MNDYRIVRTIGTTEPVSLDEAKLYLGIENSVEDNFITALIQNARLQAERFINSDIVAKERQLYLRRYDCPVNLPYAPVASVDSVSIDGVAQTLGEGYEVDGLDNPFIAVGGLGDAFARGSEVGLGLPTEKVQITYTTTGREDNMINQGILALIDEMYSGPQMSMKTNWKRWLSPFKVHGYYGQR